MKPSQPALAPVSAQSTQQIVEAMLDASQAGVFAIRIDNGSVFFTFKSVSQMGRTRRLLQDARGSMLRLIAQRPQGHSLDPTVQLHVPPADPALRQEPTPLEELKRRHAPWILILAGEGGDRLSWSGEAITCLGLIVYAEHMLGGTSS